MGCEHSLDIRIEGIKHGTIVNPSDFHYFDLHADVVTPTYMRKGSSQTFTFLLFSFPWRTEGTTCCGRTLSSYAQSRTVRAPSYGGILRSSLSFLFASSSPFSWSPPLCQRFPLFMSFLSVK